MECEEVDVAMIMLAILRNVPRAECIDTHRCGNSGPAVCVCVCDFHCLFTTGGGVVSPRVDQRISTLGHILESHHFYFILFEHSNGLFLEECRN